jgi:hypothetical protein
MKNGDTIAFSPGASVYWTQTTNFRWLRRRVKLDPFYFPDETIILVLQQCWQGSDGTQDWKDVPTVDEGQP